LFSRREFVATALIAGGASYNSIDSPPVLSPEMFGAAGDGLTNDSAAFAALSARINAVKGGTVVLGRDKTYVVGRQRPGGIRAFLPSPILELARLTRPLAIRGNGARLIAASELRYGSFDRLTGKALHAPLPNLDESSIAAPYAAMISVRGCTAPLMIRDVELDGNVRNLVIGGKWGDAGWQVPGSGLYLLDNVAQETVENVFSHHQPLDGCIISGPSDRRAGSRIARLRCEFNGRQGLSFTGGRNYDFVDCAFAQTGASVLSSAPGAGVDLEAEDNKTIRHLSFTKCRFADNAGSGLGADGGDIAEVHFADCEFVGSRNWSAWPRKPRFRFERCSFAGAVVHAYPSDDPSLACHFLDCLFSDDPALSSNGQLYFSGGPAGAVVDLDDSRNVLFSRCRFKLRHKGVLPWTSRALYDECQMVQHSPTLAMTRGKYTGRTTIEGAVNLYGSMILGDVTVNGRRLPRGPVGADFRPW
jgi:hypothetical protein